MTATGGARRVRELLDAGEVAEAIEAARDTRAAMNALAAGGWTLDGTAVRPACGCSFYRSAPAAHDRLLDLPALKPSIQHFTLLNSMMLGGAKRIGQDEHPLFLIPEEIDAFLRMHDAADGVTGANYPAREMVQIAYLVQAGSGRPAVVAA